MSKLIEKVGRVVRKAFVQTNFCPYHTLLGMVYPICSLDIYVQTFVVFFFFLKALLRVLLAKHIFYSHKKVQNKLSKIDQITGILLSFIVGHYLNISWLAPPP